jgi:hypothetical protein
MSKPRLSLSLIASVMLAIAPGAFAMKATEVEPCRQDMPKRVETLEGMFRVHVVCDQVLFEIPPSLLNRDMLLNTEFAALSAGSDYVAPGTVVHNEVGRWVRRGNQVYLESVKYEMWAENMPNLQRGVEAAQLKTVIKTFEAVGEGKDGAPIIDVTPLFVTEVPEGFAVAFMQHYRMENIDSKRSYIDSVKAFPQNVEVRFYQTWTPDRQRLIKSAAGDDPIPSALGFIFHTSFFLLPEEPMKPRYWDPRVGYFAVEFQDYGTQYHGGVRRGFIQRFRLDKKDPEAKVSEPVKPIVFYVSDEVPEVWRPWIKRAIESWQGPLEAAGFKKAILAIDAPTPEEDPTWDPEDVRFNVIRWTPSGRQNAMGAAVVDPRSGEVIASHALFWNDVLKLVETWYFTQASPLDPRAQKLPLPEDLIGELLQYVVTHEVGHALGLRHNFKAPSMVTTTQLRDPKFTHKWGTSASVMSYARFNYAAQPGDGARLIPTFGPYDYFAIEWGYSVVSHDMSCDDEWPALDQLASRQIEEPLIRFGGEDSAATLDATVTENVLGGDPIETAELGLRNIDRVMGYIIPATTSLGESYDRLAEKYEALIMQRHRELTAVTKLVGGVEEMRYQGGRGSEPFKLVAPERQRAAVKFLTERAFGKPKALLDTKVLNRIAPAGGATPLQGSNIDLLRRLIDRDVFQRMAEASSQGAGVYTGVDLLADLNAGLFSELDAAAPKIDLYRRELQRNYITILLTSTGTLQDSSDESANFAADTAYLDSGSERAAKGRHMSNLSFTSTLADVGSSYRKGRDKPSEFKAALRAGVADLYQRIEAAMKKIKDRETLLHLRLLRSQLADVS